MECDLGRLRMAIDAAREQAESDWRQRYRIGGLKVEEPTAEPANDDEFNAQMRSTIALFRKAGARA